MKVVLIFRDPGRGGKSVEAIFSGLCPLLEKEMTIVSYEYEDDRSVWYNYRRIKALEADLYHITSDIYWLSLLLPYRKSILTIHDIGHFLSMKGIKKWIYKKIYIQWPVRFAKAVTVVSLFTYETLKQLISESRLRKVVVIHNPVPLNFVQNTNSEITGYKTVLQMGTSPHKNCESVIQALKNLPYRLHIVGPLTEVQRELLSSSKVHFDHSVNTSYDRVMEAYMRATVVTFISSFEGFGMPIIEAQAIGRPVIASQNASLPEIAGAGAHFIHDPSNIDEIRDALIKVIEDTSYRNELVERGRENIKRFDRERIARQYLQVYESPIGA